MWFFRKKKRTEQDILIDRIKAERLDMQGLFSNINKRGEVEALYKELSKLSHPDKNPKKRETAHELFTKVQGSKNDYYSLLKLKEEIIDTLAE